MNKKNDKSSVDDLAKIMRKSGAPAEDKDDEQFGKDVDSILELAHKLADEDIFVMQELIEAAAGAVREDIREEFEGEEETDD